MAELVREPHQNHSPQARLHVFFRRVLGQAGKDLRELSPKRSEGVRDWNLQAFDAEISGERECIVDAAAG